MGEKGSRCEIDGSSAKPAKISNPREMNTSNGSLGACSSDRARGRREINW